MRQDWPVSDCFLCDVTADDRDALSRQSLICNTRTERVLDVMEWLESFICAPHPEAGHLGPVCAAAAEASTVGGLKILAGWDGSRPTGGLLLSAFLEISSSLPRNAAALICILDQQNEDELRDLVKTFDKQAAKLIEQNGVMIGRFHPNSGCSGTKSEAFRPMRSPHPLLVIRFMVPLDARFVETAEQQKRFEAKFGDRFQGLYSKSTEKLH
jgi:hypothetical protein